MIAYAFPSWARRADAAREAAATDTSIWDPFGCWVDWLEPGGIIERFESNRQYRDKLILDRRITVLVLWEHWRLYKADKPFYEKIEISKRIYFWRFVTWGLAPRKDCQVTQALKKLFIKSIFVYRTKRNRILLVQTFCSNLGCPRMLYSNPRAVETASYHIKFYSVEQAQDLACAKLHLQTRCYILGAARPWNDLNWPIDAIFSSNIERRGQLNRPGRLYVYWRLSLLKRSDAIQVQHKIDRVGDGYNSVDRRWKKSSASIRLVGLIYSASFVVAASLSILPFELEKMHAIASTILDERTQRLDYTDRKQAGCVHPGYMAREWASWKRALLH